MTGQMALEWMLAMIDVQDSVSWRKDSAPVSPGSPGMSDSLLGLTGDLAATATSSSQILMLGIVFIRSSLFCLAISVLDMFSE